MRSTGKHDPYKSAYAKTPRSSKQFSRSRDVYYPDTPTLDNDASWSAYAEYDHASEGEASGALNASWYQTETKPTLLEFDPIDKRRPPQNLQIYSNEGLQQQNIYTDGVPSPTSVRCIAVCIQQSQKVIKIYIYKTSQNKIIESVYQHPFHPPNFPNPVFISIGATRSCRAFNESGLVASHLMQPIPQRKVLAARSAAGSGIGDGARARAAEAVLCKIWDWRTSSPCMKNPRRRKNLWRQPTQCRRATATRRQPQSNCTASRRAD